MKENRECDEKENEESPERWRCEECSGKERQQHLGQCKDEGFWYVYSKIVCDWEREELRNCGEKRKRRERKV